MMSQMGILTLIGLEMLMIERVHQGGCFYVGNNFLSQMSKKQNFISLSTVEDKYIAIGSCCTQFLWMQKLLHDYGICQKHLIIYCDNTSAINLSKNPVQHSRTSTQRFDITSFESLSKMVYTLLNSFTLMIRRLTCSLNLLTVNGLNSFTKTLVLSPWIDLLFSSSFLMHLHLVLCIALFNLFLFAFFFSFGLFCFSYKNKK